VNLVVAVGYEKVAIALRKRVEGVRVSPNFVRARLLLSSAPGERLGEGEPCPTYRVALCEDPGPLT
jgi:hypothetical protein